MLSKTIALSLFMLSDLGLIYLHAEPERNSALIGTIHSEQGATIAAEVTAYRLGVQNGEILPHIECSTHASLQGLFQCDRIPAGIYVLVITLPPSPSEEERAVNQRPSSVIGLGLHGPSSAAAANQSPYPTPLFVYYPALDGLQAANLIHLGPRQTQTADVDIDSETMSVLKARQAPGFTTGQVQLFVQGEDFAVPLNVLPAVDELDGSYIWRGIPAGTYRLVETWTVSGDMHEAAETVVIPQETTKEISLSSNEFYPVHGMVASENPAASSTVSEVTLDTRTDGLTRHYGASVQKDGAFVIKDVAGGTYQISFAIGDHMFISEVTVGGRSANDNALTVNEATSTLPINLMASPSSASISGILELDGTELNPGIVIQSVSTGSGAAIRVQAGGKIALSGLAAGEYRISGWADISAVPFKSPAFLAHYVDRSVTLDLDEDSTVSGVDVVCSKSDLY